jgi:homoserine O-acetyltransferase
MDANTYRILTRAMDLFDLRGAEGGPERTRLTFVGVTGDQLFFADHIHDACKRWSAAGWDAAFRLMHSDHGHDAFLAETRELGELLADRI